LALAERLKATIACAHFSGHTECSGKIFGLDGKAVAERTVERGVITIRQNIHREDAAVR
jgi:hypothetical protein